MRAEMKFIDLMKIKTKRETGRNEVHQLDEDQNEAKDGKK
jgi:hypothetical protein